MFYLKTYRHKIDLLETLPYLQKLLTRVYNETPHVKCLLLFNPASYSNYIMMF
jgi:hypothetical protein